MAADSYCGIETKAVTSAVTRASNSKFSGARALLSLKVVTVESNESRNHLATANAKMADNGVGMLSSHSEYKTLTENIKPLAELSLRIYNSR